MAETVPNFPRVRMVMSGTLRTSQTWSTGMYAKLLGAPDLSALQTWIGGIRDALDAQLLETQTPRAVWDASTRVLEYSAYYYAASAPTASLVAVATAGNNPGASTGYMPSQVSVVASLHTAMAGRKGRGRMYWPATSLTLDANGRVNSGICDDLAYFSAFVATRLGADTLGGGLPVAVVAGAVAGGVPITSVTCDNRPDIQRRRADKIAATYHGTQAVPVS